MPKLSPTKNSEKITNAKEVVAKLANNVGKRVETRPHTTIASGRPSLSAMYGATSEPKKPPNKMQATRSPSR